MKVLPGLVAVVIIMLFFFGCGFHSIVDFESEEIPSDVPPKNLPQDILQKYSLGQALILPAIVHSGGGDQFYQLGLFIFSGQKDLSVAVKDVSLSIEGKDVPYGQELLGNTLSALKYDKDYGCYFLYIYGSELEVADPETKERIDVSIDVEVKTDADSETEGTIKATFYPKKRTYFE